MPGEWITKLCKSVFIKHCYVLNLSLSLQNMIKQVCLIYTICWLIMTNKVNKIEAIAHSATLVVPRRKDLTDELIVSNLFLKFNCLSMLAKTERLDLSNASTGWDIHRRWNGTYLDWRFSATPSPIYKFLVTESIIKAVVFSHKVFDVTGCSGVLIVADKGSYVSNINLIIWAWSS